MDTNTSTTDFAEAQAQRDAARRAAALDGLRALLDFLDAHPDVPVQALGCRVTYCVPGHNDEVGLAELQRIAAVLGGDLRHRDEHHTALRSFGAVSYEATYIEREHMARYERGQQFIRDHPEVVGGVPGRKTGGK